MQAQRKAQVRQKTILLLLKTMGQNMRMIMSHRKQPQMMITFLAAGS